MQGLRLQLSTLSSGLNSKATPDIIFLKLPRLMFNLLPISKSTKPAHTAEAFLNILQDRETKVRRYYRQQTEARAYVTPQKQDVPS